jgi:hypothetical protein
LFEKSGRLRRQPRRKIVAQSKTGVSPFSR